jgi:hypothetical protein
MNLTIGSIKIRPHDHWEVKDENTIWVWHGEDIRVLRSDAMLMSLLIREWQEEHRHDEQFNHGAGI